MKSPLVAVAARSKAPGVIAKIKPYTEWVTRGGGVPRLIAPGDRAPLAGVQGLLLVGGEDVAPERYGETNRHCETINPERDAFELTLLKSALRRNLPILAVCRGIQVLAVAIGGTLYQDLPREMDTGSTHRGPRETDTTHSITVEVGSRLAGLIRRHTLTVNSHHHQAVRALPKSARIVACSTDHVIEAVEYPAKRFVIGVQWHPERWDHPSSAALMKGFLAACRPGRSRAAR